jgi:hypothetical protein
VRNFMPQGRDGARRYARVLDAAYGALKQVERDNVVIGGMTLSGGFTVPPVWIKQMRLPGGRPPRMDWYGHNPFERRTPRLSDPPTRARGGRKRGLNDSAPSGASSSGRTAASGAMPAKLWLGSSFSPTRLLGVPLRLAARRPAPPAATRWPQPPLRAGDGGSPSPVPWGRTPRPGADDLSGWRKPRIRLPGPPLVAFKYRN